LSSTAVGIAISSVICVAGLPSGLDTAGHEPRRASRQSALPASMAWPEVRVEMSQSAPHLGFAPEGDAPVPYMQRIRDYYLALGYAALFFAN